MYHLKRAREDYAHDYETYLLCDPEGTKYEWAASHVFNLVTYDGDIDKVFVEAIIEVCEVILERRNYDYIKDPNNYIKYLMVCQLLYDRRWIGWGTSIRGAWFENYTNDPEPILEMNAVVPFTEVNLNALIKFIKE